MPFVFLSFIKLSDDFEQIEQSRISRAKSRGNKNMKTHTLYGGYNFRLIAFQSRQQQNKKEIDRVNK